MELITNLFNNLEIFLQVFTRIIGFFIVAPVFNQGNIPTYMKIGFSLLLTLIIFPIVNIFSHQATVNFISFLIVIGKELITGILLGFICNLFFSSIYLAGHIIDMELGFSIASVINPQDDTEIPLTANLFYIIAVLIFLSINGHYSFIYALKRCFDFIPLGSLNFNTFMLDKLIAILINTFIIAFKMGAPVLISLFLSNVLLGIMARTVPQMNVFVVGMPLKITVGLIVLLLIIPQYVGFFEYIFDTMFDHLQDFFITFTKGW